MTRSLTLTIPLLFTAALASGYTITKETAATSDGVTLAMKRYKSGGTPVILCHGIVQNQACMDLGVAGSSLAQYLADKGYDVWVCNLRSHGKGTYKSGSSGNWDWAIDEFAAYDVPAIVNKVKSATGGKKPFWIGHSMGGMAAYGYLEGVKVQSVKVDEVWGWGWCGIFPCYGKLYDVYDKRIVRDPNLAAQRNAGLRGLITLGSPVRLKWKYDVTIWNYWMYDYYDYNLLVSELAKSQSANDALGSVQYLPFGTLTGYLSGDIRNLPYIGGPLASFLQWVFGNIGTSYLTAEVWYPSDMSAAISQAVINTTIDDTESRVCQQFFDGIRNKTWREYHVSDPFHAPYVYADHYDSITGKVCVIAGNKDKMCNDDTAYVDGFQRMGSTDKTWRDFASFGHDDLVIGVNAGSQVYPFIYGWLAAR